MMPVEGNSFHEIQKDYLSRDINHPCSRGYFGFRAISRSRMDRLLNSTLPGLVEEVKYMALSEGLMNWKVYSRASELRKVMRNSPGFTNFWKDLTVPVNISSEPVGKGIR